MSWAWRCTFRRVAASTPQLRYSLATGEKNMTKAWTTLAGTVVLSLTIAGDVSGQAQQGRRGQPAPQARPAQQESHDYWSSQREMIRRGQQAIMMCNGLFTSNRTLEQIYSQ